jgi:hypothetical protein
MMNDLNYDSPQYRSRRAEATPEELRKKAQRLREEADRLIQMAAQKEADYERG